MNDVAGDLTARSGRPSKGGDSPLEQGDIDRLLQRLSGWAQSGGELVKTYEFEDYYETIAFVNATAWVSHREDHHPDLEVGYRQCRVRYSTHAIGGLSQRDFVCAARIDSLLAGPGA